MEDQQQQQPENASAAHGGEDVGRNGTDAGDERPSAANPVKKDGSHEISTDEEGDNNADTAADTVFFEEGEEGKEFRVPLRLTKSGRKRATPFPLKLMKVLSEGENLDIVAWTASGKAFMIFQPKLFCTKVLPDEFKSAKFSSFTRKLHRWGFMRHYRGEDAGAFYHKNFQKGRMDLVEKMSCYKPLAAGAASAAKEDFCFPQHTGPSSLDGNPVSASASTPGALTAENTGSSAIGGQSSIDTNILNSAMLQQQLFNGQLQHQGLVQQPPGLLQQNDADPDGQKDLNAAIEYEVARRLKERINDAAFSRQSMLTMATTPHQQPQNMPGGFDPTFMLQQAQQSNAAGMSSFAHMGTPPVQQPMQGQLFPQQWSGLPFFNQQAPMGNPFMPFDQLQQLAMFNQNAAQLNMMQQSGNNLSCTDDNSKYTNGMSNFKTG